MKFATLHNEADELTQAHIKGESAPGPQCDLVDKTLTNCTPENKKTSFPSHHDTKIAEESCGCASETLLIKQPKKGSKIDNIFS